jgi:hypothetical protein
MALQASDDPEHTQCDSSASTDHGRELDAEFTHVDPIH